MKIKRIIFLFFVFVFILLLPSIIFFVSNLFFQKNFIFANNINKNLELVFKNNDLLKLKKADYYYKISEYEKAYEKYSEIDCNKKYICFILNHNLWNTAYKIWEKLNNLDKLNYWQKSLFYYSKALSIKYDEETKKNYDFVLEKLNKLKNEIKKENLKNQSKDNWPKNDQNTKNNQSNESNDWQNKQNNWEKNDVSPKWPSIKINDDTKKSYKPLSEEEKKQIEDYLKSLREEEKQNIELNKPQEDRDIFDILQEDFFTPFDKKEDEW